MQFKVDLHSHSIISHDGGITAPQYRELLEQGIVDFIAVTDHNKIDLALALRAELGDKIIVGEEVMTSEGEVIGLFLKTFIKTGMSAAQTAQAIKNQGGLVYIPHPFEITRHGLSSESLEAIKTQVDIIEVFNARSKEPWLSPKAKAFAEENDIAKAASSDAHHLPGVGQTYSLVEDRPDQTNLKMLLAKATYQEKKAGLASILAPTINRTRKFFKV